jgi:dihydrodipicolinate synthase/N-acetylneuraminate lyase
MMQTLKELGKLDHLPVIVGIYGENSSEAIQDLSNCLKADPSISLVLPPPLKIKLDPDAQWNFFSTVIKATKNPVFIYNNPTTFGGTEINPGVVEKLLQFENFLGIKDSAGNIQMLKAYLQWLSPRYTVSCGKEGMLAQFLELVPAEQRAMVGIVPSISNLVNTCGKIFELGIAGKDKDMVALQTELNRYRKNIYDSAVEKGKAQRGLKIAFQKLYQGTGINFPTTVKPDFERDVPMEISNEIGAKVKWAVENKHIVPLP